MRSLLFEKNTIINMQNLGDLHDAASAIDIANYIE